MKTLILPNGLRIILDYRPKSTTSAVSIGSCLGSRHETPKINGLTHLFEHLATSGSIKFPGILEIERAFDTIGADFNAEVNASSIIMYAHTNNSGLYRALEILTDLLLHPILTKASLERERRVVLTEIGENGSGECTEDVLGRLMYGDHPINLPFGGTPDTLGNLTVADLRAHWHRVTRPNRMGIVVSGKFSEPKILAFVLSKFGRLKSGLPPMAEPYVRIQRKPRLRIRTVDQNHTDVCLAFPTVRYRHGDRLRLFMLADILGGRGSSRLYTHLRGEGLVYSVNCYSSHWFDTGNFSIITSTRPNLAPEVLEIILAELRNLKDHLPSKDGMHLAKISIVESTKRKFHDPLYSSTTYIKDLLAHGEVVSPRQLIAEIRKIRRSHIREAARRVFLTRFLNLLVQGNVCSSNRKIIKKMMRI